MRPPPPAPKVEDLEPAALAYLARFSSSQASLRRVLLRRLSRAEAQGVAVDRAVLVPAITALIERLAARGYLNDATYAQGLATSLRGRGRSRRAVQHALSTKGVEAEVASEALAQVDADTEGDAELTAARRLAQRRRLGPFRRDASERAERREKDLAVLGRAGFPYAIARKVIDAVDDSSD